MSSRYYRWDAKGGERESLFSRLEYVRQDRTIPAFHGLYPKVGSVPAMRALATLLGQRHVVGEQADGPGVHALYWVRVPGYFCQFFLTPPRARPEGGGPERIRGEVLSPRIRQAETCRILHSILNSSTYYQFFCAYTDGRHINPSDVIGFPLDLQSFGHQSRRLLGQLSLDLEKCMASNTKEHCKSGLLIDSVESKPCKPIIDEIDRVLARHYQFTDEELDFITNYDINIEWARTQTSRLLDTSAEQQDGTQSGRDSAASLETAIHDMCSRG